MNIYHVTVNGKGWYSEASNIATAIHRTVRIYAKKQNAIHLKIEAKLFEENTTWEEFSKDEQ